MTVAAPRPSIGERTDTNYWCVTHDCADGTCGVIGRHNVIPIDEWITPIGSVHDDATHAVMLGVSFDNPCKRGECRRQQ